MKFVRRNEELLARRPVWLINSGPVGDERVDEEGIDLLEVARPKEFDEPRGRFLETLMSDAAVDAAKDRSARHVGAPGNLRPLSLTRVCSDCNTTAPPLHAQTCRSDPQ